MRFRVVLGYGVAVDVVSFFYHRCDGSEKAVARFLLMKIGCKVASAEPLTFEKGTIDRSLQHIAMHLTLV